MNVRQELFDNQDLAYKNFHSKLVPNLSCDKIIGVRVPILRKLAKKVLKENAELEAEYYEEKMLKGFVIGYKKCSIDEHIAELEQFIPLIDNWAVCDCTAATFKFTNNNRAVIWDFLQKYINGSEYEVRFAVVMLMNYFFVDDYIDDALKILKSIKREEYYINMAVAWALSVAYVKYKEKTLPLLNDNVLTPWVHNKTIQKICESYRIDKDEKVYLKTLKVKESE